jgi:pSer/pThr/pTyr-binding forkhead associated (FHA) protein
MHLALRSTRPEFVAKNPHPLLYGAGGLVRPRGPQPTKVFERGGPEAEQTRTMRIIDDAQAPAMLLAVRKTQEAFPSMVTVGRTSNNDLVVSDINVSKFHAWFRVAGGKVDLTDAGSRNGTFVGRYRLQAKGPARPVFPGDEVRFGNVAFLLLDAGAAWDRLHAPSTEW